MRTKPVGLFLIALLLAVVSSRATRAQASLSREAGLRTMRGVLTLEVEGAATGGSWVDIAAVVRLSEKTPNAWRPVDGSRTKIVDEIVDSSTARVMDYTLQLTPSDDHKHFQVSLTPTVHPVGSRPSWFADEHLVIYVGQPIQ